MKSISLKHWPHLILTGHPSSHLTKNTTFLSSLLFVLLTLTLFTIFPVKASAQTITNVSAPDHRWDKIDVRSSRHQLKRTVNATKPFQADNLIYRGSLELKSNSKRFGGYSGLAINENGTQLYAISDRSHWLKLSLQYDQQGHLLSANDGALLTVLGENNITRFPRGDSEGVEQTGSEILVAFEGHPRVERYQLQENGIILHQDTLFDFNHLKKLRTNKSLESVARIDSQTVITIAEQNPDNKKGDIPGYIITKNQQNPFFVKKTRKFSITDVTHHNGSLYFLERYFNKRAGLFARLSTYKLDDKVDGGPNDPLSDKTIIPTQLASFGLLHKLDNFEGITVRTDKEGHTFIYILSDDNFRGRQKTLLVMFELAP